MNNRPHFPKRAVITGGMPYGNKNLHFGHIAGVFVPADFFARFLRDRIGQKNVLFISGTDCYGSPIAEGYRKKVEEEDYEGTILDYVNHNHNLQKSALNAYNISLDFYGGAARTDPPARGPPQSTTGSAEASSAETFSVPACAAVLSLLSLFPVPLLLSVRTLA